MMKRWIANVLLYTLVLWASGSAQNSAPEIVFVDFPKQMQADGKQVLGFVGFKDADGDLSRAEFSVVQAKDFQPFTVELKTLKGVKEGVFEFQIATTTTQQVTLRVTLVDEAGNRSPPKEFSFEAAGPLTGAILQVSPTSLSFSSEEGRNPPSQTIQITNAGTGILNWSANSDHPWIGLSPNSGTAPSAVTVSVNAVNLAAGSYTGRVTVTAPGAQGSPAVVTVSISLEPRRPAYTVCPSGCRHSSIGSAIAAARSGETITIGPGTYYENLTINKDLALQGERGTQTTIKGANPGWPVITIESDSEIGVALESLNIGEAKRFNNDRMCAVENPQWICPYGISVRGRARVTIQNALVLSNADDGFNIGDEDMSKSAQVTLSSVHISGNGSDGIDIWGSARLALSDVTVSGNGGILSNANGLEVGGFAVVEVRNSTIEGNGMSPPCRQTGIWNICSGIMLYVEGRITIINSIIRDNTDWGVTSYLRSCGYDSDQFTGRVAFEGTTTIEGNNKSSNQKGMGNPGNHPFKNLPDGQVCLP